MVANTKFMANSGLWGEIHGKIHGKVPLEDVMLLNASLAK